MAKKPTEGKQPEEESPDQPRGSADEVDLDGLDFEDLLEEMGVSEASAAGPADAGPAKTPEVGGPRTGKGAGPKIRPESAEVVDDGEIDLVEEEPQLVSEDDVIELEGSPAESAGLEDTPVESAGLAGHEVFGEASETAFAEGGQAREEGASAGGGAPPSDAHTGSPEEIPLEELLAEDVTATGSSGEEPEAVVGSEEISAFLDEGTPSKEGGIPAKEEAAEEGPLAADEAPLDLAEETVLEGEAAAASASTAASAEPGAGAQAAAESGDETAAVTPAAKEKAKGKGKFPKFSKKFGKKAKEAKEAEAAPVPEDAEAAAVTEEGAQKEEGGAEGEEEPDKKKRKFGEKVKERAKEEKAKKDKAAREKALVAADRSGASLTFVCSECYEELLISPKYSQELVSCPECLHVGKRPDEDFLRTVRLHKAGERKSLTAALACGVLLVLALIGLIWIKSPYYVASHGKPDDMLIYGFAGGAGIFGLLLLWMVVKFEGNRWEVYF